MFGGSWGSTLALLYAQTHPERVAGLILRGIFLCRQSEIDWFLYGMRTVFPEAWRAFAGFLPEAERADLLAGYYRRLIDPDPRVHMPAARAWSIYEGGCSTLLPNPETVAAFGEDRLALGLARIEAHFFTEHLFPPESDLVANIGSIRHLPAVIVQGRYDMVCPIRSADELALAWPEAEYVDRARRRPFGDGARHPRAARSGDRAGQALVAAALAAVSLAGGILASKMPGQAVGGAERSSGAARAASRRGSGVGVIARVIDPGKDRVAGGAGLRDRLL